MILCVSLCVCVRARIILAVSSFCAPTPLQHAVAQAIADKVARGQAAVDSGEDPVLDCGATDIFHANFIALTEALRESGVEPLPSAGGYFLLADCSKVCG